MALRCFLLLFYLQCCLSRAIAQSPGTLSADPVLVNGKISVFHPPGTTEGNQYLAGPEFATGSLVLKGFSYTGLLLNYDVYNQQLILKYKSNTGALNRIIVSDAWIERFSIDNLNFIMFRNNREKTIYQVIGDGIYQVLFHWMKSLELSQVHGASNSVFSKPRRTMYLFHDGRISEFRNNKGFVGLFDAGKGEKILDYLQGNKVNVRKAPDSKIAELVSFANALPE